MSRNVAHLADVRMTVLTLVYRRSYAAHAGVFFLWNVKVNKTVFKPVCCLWLVMFRTSDQWGISLFFWFWQKGGAVQRKSSAFCRIAAMVEISRNPIPKRYKWHDDYIICRNIPARYLRACGRTVDVSHSRVFRIGNPCRQWRYKGLEDTCAVLSDCAPMATIWQIRSWFGAS